MPIIPPILPLCHDDTSANMLNDHGILFNGAESTCDADNSDFSMVIPIIVGAVLAGLIVIVIVAYVIGRNRANNENSYETI